MREENSRMIHLENLPCTGGGVVFNRGMIMAVDFKIFSFVMT